MFEFYRLDVQKLYWQLTVNGQWKNRRESNTFYFKCWSLTIIMTNLVLLFTDDV